MDPLSSDYRLWTNPLISLKVSRVQHLYLVILTFLSASISDFEHLSCCPQDGLAGVNHSLNHR